MCRLSISLNSFVVGVLSQFTGPEEVLMHPKLIIALANEVQRDRESERHKVHLRSLAVTNRGHGFDSPSAAGGVARRLFAGISLQPRVS
jgi:hypothetical protein